ncbi:MAG: acetyl-CoA carboxylase, carboxyltransferase subunit beta [Actinobacteria bacterium]|nr:acetyl-CoA carboxylase, carboxyltransferase subunit beta [Actinomycetota bacterium]MCL5882516.1 acetyl-CoA carboxylase, carboxyltransferase subunit beta [Actinomycetota bacterium]
MAQRVSVDISRRGGNDNGAQSCPGCKELLSQAELGSNSMVCPHCGHHFRMNARQRIDLLADPGSWAEIAANLRSADPLEFFDLRPYSDRLEEAEYDTGLSEAMLAGRAKMNKMDVVLAVMDFAFIGGSMGSVVGERFWRAAEEAIEQRFPLVVVCSSGGARMQEGILSLLQMAKTTCAVELMGEVPVPFISVLTHPTTGGVMASFATLADVIIAEPRAFLSFSGPRIIEQTIKEKLPEDFGMAETNVKNGQVDMIVPRLELKDKLVQILGMLEGGVACALEPLWKEETRFAGRGGAFTQALNRIKTFANPSRRPPQG